MLHSISQFPPQRNWSLKLITLSSGRIRDFSATISMSVLKKTWKFLFDSQTPPFHNWSEFSTQQLIVQLFNVPTPSPQRRFSEVLDLMSGTSNSEPLRPPAVSYPPFLISSSHVFRFFPDGLDRATLTAILLFLHFVALRKSGWHLQSQFILTTRIYWRCLT